MKTWKLIIIYLQVLFLVCIPAGYYYHLNNPYLFYFAIGGIQIVDSIFSYLKRNNAKGLINRTWHLWYCAATLFPYLLYLLTGDDNNDLIICDILVLLFTSPLIALNMFITNIREYNNIKAYEKAGIEQ